MAFSRGNNTFCCHHRRIVITVVINFQTVFPPFGLGTYRREPCIMINTSRGRFPTTIRRRRRRRLRWTREIERTRLTDENFNATIRPVEKRIPSDRYRRSDPVSLRCRWGMVIKSRYTVVTATVFVTTTGNLDD